MKLREDIASFLATIPENVNVVCASKYVSADGIIEAYNHKIKAFGENRVEAFLDKYEKLKDLDISWHFIGHLQRNKAKKIINKIDYLHSLDSLKLCDVIEIERIKPLNCFIEVSINLEESKNGVDYRQIDTFVSEVLKYKKINLIGLMMMAIKNDGEDDLNCQFNKLYELKLHLERKFNLNSLELSMGMSDDFRIAIKNHATFVRLGRILWKE